MTEPERAAPYHAMEVEDAVARLRSGPYGLTSTEARDRLAAYGPNRLKEDAGVHPLIVAFRQFTNPIVALLLLAAVVTLFLQEYLDAIVIAAAVVLNAVIGFFQERSAERSVRALMRMVAPQAHVIRDGREWLIASVHVVAGDVVLLESGWKVPADLRLLMTNALSVDESLLTGESASVDKHERAVVAGTAVADRRCMAYAGTVVTSGRGRGLVVATGEATELGAIAASMRREVQPPTPLQRRMTVFARVVGAAVVAAAVVAFAVGVAKGEPPSSMFRVAVAMAVSAIPEGLPLAFTITLALGVRRMASRKAIVRHLPAVETLGSTTVIGSDKTGTLTENRMTVLEVWTAGASIRVERLEVREDLPEAVRLTLLAGVLANEAEVFVTEDGPESHGDPTEVALLEAAAKFGIEHEEARSRYASRREIPFEPVRQYSGSVREEDGGEVLYIKGGPERVLQMCDRMMVGDEVVAIDAGAVHAAATELASRGLRVLAMARGGGGELPSPDRGPDGLVFLGMQGMMDPPREGVREAIVGCRAAGIRVVMITGDHAATALAIARQLGIADEGDGVLTGNEMGSIPVEELPARCATVSVYARVAPEQKLRIVRALQSLGHVVAVTGDGVNDAPALKVADIGVAMGKSGTDVAREAADIVLADDNFVSIYAAVEEGRVTFDNIRKVTFFLVSTGVAEVIAIMVALVAGWPLPFLAAQILWLNLVTNGLQDVALAFEPGEPGVLKQPPRSPREGLLSRLMWERTLLAGFVMSAGTLFMFRWELDRGASDAVAQTTALTTMVLFQVMHVGNARTERQSAFRRSPFSNPFLFVCTAAALAAHVAALYLPPTQYVLRFEPVSLDAWLWIVPVALSVIVAVELHKLVRSRGGILRNN
ncbi:MAG: ATPase [Anaerolinea sp.]|nr:ATPase [Anaerolinea sp.]